MKAPLLYLIAFFLAPSTPLYAKDPPGEKSNAPFQLGAKPNAASEWRSLRSGYRTYSNEASQRYGETYLTEINAILLKIESPAYTFDDFLRQLEKGCERANQAALGTNAGSLGYGSRKNSASKASVGFTLFSERDNSLKGKKEQEAIQKEEAMKGIVNDFHNTLLQKLKSPVDPQRTLDEESPVLENGVRLSITPIQDGKSFVEVTVPITQTLKDPKTGKLDAVHLLDHTYIFETKNPRAPDRADLKLLKTDYVANTKEFEKVQNHLAQLYPIAKDRSRPAEAEAAAREMTDLLRKTVMHVKGGSGIADAMMITLAKFHGGFVGEVAPGKGTDMQAWQLSHTPSAEELRRIYKRSYPDDICKVIEVFSAAGT